MHLIKYSVCFLVLSLLIACGGNSSSSSASSDLQINLTGFSELAIPNSNATLVTKKDGAGKMIEQGIVRAGQKDGPWTVFHENESIKSITTYINGILNGAHLEFNNRGQLEKRVEYLNNNFHGLYGEYKYGRPLKEINYTEGIQEGPFRIWNDMGKLKQRGTNKNGKLEGTLDYFDDEENKIMSYEYKNGEVVSGGMLN